MCGIAGYWNANREKPVDEKILTGMAAVLHHRGPDDFGWMKNQSAGVGFAHARLSIIGLDRRGRQPMATPDDRLMLVHNGEFYDYKRIRADLVSRGERFYSKSDSELVLHLVPMFGLEQTLPYLRGEFAFALYDASNDELILVRDRFGIKPLYYTDTGGSIVFGSEIKALFAHPDVNRQYDDQGVYHQLMQLMVPGTTAYRGVKQVPPGSAIVIRRTENGFQSRTISYWDMPFPEKDTRPQTYREDDYIELIREKLIEAVRLRLEADVPVGCYLSGGIDSCSILGLSAAAMQSSVKAYTISFDDEAYDESDIAREMAASTKADHDILSLSSDHLYDHFVETHWYTERTIYNTLGVAKLLMSRHVRNSGYHVVVTGEGSDELFGGYPAFRRDMFLHGMDDMDPAERKEWQQMLEDSNKLFKGAMLAREEVHDPALHDLFGFTPSSLQPWLSTEPYAKKLIHPERKSALSDYSPGAAIAATFNRDALHNRHPLDKAQYAWIKTMLEGQILTWGGDRVDMANSMEARPAFLDHHLAQAAATLPPSMRIKGKIEKYVLREAMKGLLPEVLYKREKFAFMAPPAHTDPEKYRALKGLASDYLSDQAIDDAGVLNKEEVKKIFERHESGDASVDELVHMDAVINHMLGVQILHRNLIQRDIPAFAQQRAKELGWHAPEGDVRNMRIAN